MNSDAVDTPTGTVRIAVAEQMLAPVSRAQIREAVKRGFPRGAKFGGAWFINLSDLEECVTALREGRSIESTREQVAVAKMRDERNARSRQTRQRNRANMAARGGVK